MKKYTLFYIIVLALALSAFKSETFVYTSFHEPATDGLRFLTSDDLLTEETVEYVI